MSETDRVIIKRCNEAYATLFQGAVARIRHTLGAWLNQRKNYVVFPPSVDSLFIRQSPAGTSSEFAVITGAMNAQ